MFACSERGGKMNPFVWLHWWMTKKVIEGKCILVKEKK